MGLRVTSHTTSDAGSEDDVNQTEPTLVRNAKHSWYVCSRACISHITLRFTRGRQAKKRRLGQPAWGRGGAQRNWSPRRVTKGATPDPVRPRSHNTCYASRPSMIYDSLACNCGLHLFFPCCPGAPSWARCRPSWRRRGSPAQCVSPRRSPRG